MTLLEYVIIAIVGIVLIVSYVGVHLVWAIATILGVVSFMVHRLVGVALCIAILALYFMFN
ncbi:hypothetical protein [Vibrio ishigakensis]|uniref:hypothetical protein n=1 Tax=Vibrio ishigakensis TaxID=1481914 RepID=UPI0021C31D40|nr:hypothetical protein [Vibrio ishigakensis]